MVFRQSGALPAKALEDIIVQIKELDIEAALAEQQAADRAVSSVRRAARDSVQL